MLVNCVLRPNSNQFQRAKPHIIQQK
uniref:Uncharacterized protein n=1 Tax=Arundo donax TaxID=35708 RepID=A0A0A9EDQ7_ARUDO